jgi:CDP-6-deoxy-D-xylo-4-hexulose-3-dehydrase
LSSNADQIRQEILNLVEKFAEMEFPETKFVPGTSPVPVSGRVFDGQDVSSLVNCSLDFWLTAGPYSNKFESKFKKLFNHRWAFLVNSGSSANLVAVSSLLSPLLKERRLRAGDEVITVAAGFPTTVNPIVQNNLVPVFVDVEVSTYNIDVEQLEAALSVKTKAVVIAHTLGNPFNLAAVMKFCKQHDLFLVEDCCDAVGGQYDGKPVGSFGDLATASFYPAHHITMGEGGCVLTSSGHLKSAALSIRDWGRDCWCDPGKENTCGLRFDQTHGGLPPGFDHKYVYSHIGYNLKLTDMQAAIGLSQLTKLDGFHAARQRNFEALSAGLADLEEFFILPKATENSQPSWFGFPIAIRTGAPFNKSVLVQFLEKNLIATRMLFAGNIIHQPAYAEVNYRQIGDLPNSDFVMTNVFWVGIYPGLTTDMIDYMIEIFHDAVTPGKGLI